MSTVNMESIGVERVTAKKEMRSAGTKSFETDRSVFCINKYLMKRAIC